MDDAILQVNGLKVSELQHELRNRGLPVSGIKEDLRRRLIEALRMDYDDGWTLGYLLNTRIIPFSSKGIDPQTLVGLHVERVRAENGTIRILISDGDDLTIFAQPSSVAIDPVRVRWDAEYSSSGYRKPSKESPLCVLEAVMAERKNDQGEVSGVLFGFRLERMEKIMLFGCAKGKEAPSNPMGDVYLEADKDSRHPDLVREELLFPNSG